MAKIAENVKFVDDLQEALREILAVFPVSELKFEQKLTIENIVGEMFSDNYRREKYEKSRAILAYISSNV